jgi:hypothetical protein
LIASEAFYHDVIEQDPAADAASYRPIAVSVKQTQATAWLRLPDVSTPAPAPVPARPAPARQSQQSRPSPRAQAVPLSDIVDALLDLPFVREVTGRSMLIDMLPPNIANAVPYHAMPRLHVFALVRTCLQYEHGLDSLIEAVRQLDGDSRGVRRLEGIERLLLSDSVD